MRNTVKKMMLLLTMLMLSAMMVIPAHAANMKLNKKKATINVGQTVKLKVKGTKKKVSWKSSNKAVATVSKGLVRGKAEGSAKITAKVGKKKMSCYITVKAPASGQEVPTPVVTEPETAKPETTKTETKEPSTNQTQTQTKTQTQTQSQTQSQNATVRVLFNQPNNYYETVNTVTIVPTYVRFENGALIADSYIINGYGRTVYNVNVEDYSLYDSNKNKYACGNFGIIGNGGSIAAHSWVKWTFTFKGAAVLNWNPGNSDPIHYTSSVKNMY